MPVHNTVAPSCTAFHDHIFFTSLALFHNTYHL